MTLADSLAKFLILVAVVAPVAADATQETIPEATARGAIGRDTTAGSGIVANAPDVFAETDVIIRGFVGQPQSFLSEDQRNIYTEYPIINPVILYDSQVTTSARPGPLATAPIAVTQLGGTLTIDGRPFRQRKDGLPPLQPGSEGLFLLRRVGSHYHIVGNFSGAFAIVAVKLEPLAARPLFGAEYKGAPVVQAAVAIVERVRALRSKR